MLAATGCVLALNLAAIAPAPVRDQEAAELTDRAVAAINSGDTGRGRRLLQSAMAQGYPRAYYYMASVYEQGAGVPKDPVRAYELYRASAEKRFLPALEMMGWLSETGRGTYQNYNSAAAWYRRAADKGSSIGAARLGLLYKTGRGVGIDQNEAAKWLKLGAERGDWRKWTLLYELGTFYGSAFSRDIVEAYAWFLIAGQPAAARAKDALAQASKLAAEMSAAQRQAATERALALYTGELGRPETEFVRDPWKLADANNPPASQK